MTRPKIEKMQNVLHSITSKSILQGTIIHLIEYIEFLEEELEAMQLDWKTQTILNEMGGD